jgi:hypothetical protein
MRCWSLFLSVRYTKHDIITALLTVSRSAHENFSSHLLKFKGGRGEKVIALWGVVATAAKAMQTSEDYWLVS